MEPTVPRWDDPAVRACVPISPGLRKREDVAMFGESTTERATHREEVKSPGGCPHFRLDRSCILHGFVSVVAADRRPRLDRSARRNAPLAAGWNPATARNGVPRAAGRSPATERDRRSLKQSGKARQRRSLITPIRSSGLRTFEGVDACLSDFYILFGTATGNADTADHVAVVVFEWDSTTERDDPPVVRAPKSVQ